MFTGSSPLSATRRSVRAPEDDDFNLTQTKLEKENLTMSSTHWLRNLKSDWHYSRLAGNSRRAARSKAAARRRPQVEALEDRFLPSTLTVLNNLDSGIGSLRAEVAAASSGDPRPRRGPTRQAALLRRLLAPGCGRSNGHQPRRRRPPLGAGPGLAVPPIVEIVDRCHFRARRLPGFLALRDGGSCDLMGHNP